VTLRTVAAAGEARQHVTKVQNANPICASSLHLSRGIDHQGWDLLAAGPCEIDVTGSGHCPASWPEATSQLATHHAHRLPGKHEFGPVARRFEISLQEEY